MTQNDYYEPDTLVTIIGNVTARVLQVNVGRGGNVTYEVGYWDSTNGWRQIWLPPSEVQPHEQRGDS